MQDYLKKLEARYGELEKFLCSAEASKRENYPAALKEISELKPAVDLWRRISSVEKSRQSCAEVLREAEVSGDAKMLSLARDEMAGLAAELQDLEQKLKLTLTPPDENSGKNVIIEIRAGTGGEESALFAGVLFRMYERFAAAKNFETETLNSSPTDLGGFKEIVFLVKGKNAWKNFKFESGVHRVQRVPATEAQGRIHTSAVSVAVLAEADEVELKIDEKDLRIDTYRASGAGGQHVNKTDSAVRITHLPTGLVVACQEDRSQIKNRATAMKLLRARLADAAQRQKQNEMASLRKKQIGSGDRSEKIRTYNFPQSRLTDHRINESFFNLPEILEGRLDEVIDKISAIAAERAFAEMTSEPPCRDEKK